MKHIYNQTMKMTSLSYKDFGKIKAFYAFKFKLLQLRNLFISIENALCFYMIIWMELICIPKTTKTVGF